MLHHLQTHVSCLQSNRLIRMPMVMWSPLTSLWKKSKSLGLNHDWIGYEMGDKYHLNSRALILESCKHPCSREDYSGGRNPQEEVVQRLEAVPLEVVDSGVVSCKGVTNRCSVNPNPKHNQLRLTLVLVALRVCSVNSNHPNSNRQVDYFPPFNLKIKVLRNNKMRGDCLVD